MLPRQFSGRQRLSLKVLYAIRWTATSFTSSQLSDALLGRGFQIPSQRNALACTWFPWPISKTPQM